MKVIIEDRAMRLRDRLRERLERAEALRCEDHGEAIVAVTINGRENGWFDTTWLTCCDRLTRQAVAIVKERC